MEHMSAWYRQEWLPLIRSLLLHRNILFAPRLPSPPIRLPFHFLCIIMRTTSLLCSPPHNGLYCALFTVYVFNNLSLPVPHTSARYYSLTSDCGPTHALLSVLPLLLLCFLVVLHTPPTKFSSRSPTNIGHAFIIATLRTFIHPVRYLQRSISFVSLHHYSTRKL